jgi:hypothetical protein
VHGNLHNTLDSREVSVRWIPNQLTEYCRCSEHLIWYEETNGAFLNQTVTGNEARVHHVTAEKKFKIEHSAQELRQKAPCWWVSNVEM